MMQREISKRLAKWNLEDFHQISFYYRIKPSADDDATHPNEKNINRFKADD